MCVRRFTPFSPSANKHLLYIIKQLPPTTGQPSKKDYYYRRIAELGLSEREARHQYGFTPSDNGDIILAAFHYNGEPVEFIPGNRRKAFKNMTGRKSSGEVHEGSYYRQYGRVRVHPDRLKPGGAKYYSVGGENVPPFPMPAARAAYQAKKTGGHICFIEGEFKGAALDKNGIETVAFGGIGLYKLDHTTRDYITTRRPDVILVTYDGDFNDVRRDKKNGQITSQRAKNFYNSAAKFTGQLVNYLESIEHKAKIVWVAVNPDNPAKGADDLLAAANNPAEVVHQLTALKETDNWTFTKLSPTTYEAKLKARFALDSAERFYHAHAAEIGQYTFTFFGLDFKMNEGILVMESDPFAVDLDLIPLTITEYLDEETAALDKLLKRYTCLAIQSDTGSGKTTYLIEWAKRTNRRLVIVVPTRSLCKQLAKDHGIFAMYGANTSDRAADAAAAQIVVATYDTVHHLPDLETRVLVIDECHNLVNQYGQIRKSIKLFRAHTLNRLQQLAKTAAQVVYLSGTMPKALLKAYNVPLVDVRRLDSPTVRLHRLTAHNSKVKAHTSALLSQLSKDIEEQPNQVHFAILNNLKELTKVRALVIGSGRLQADEIEVISRGTYEAGETSAFNDLVDISIVRPGVRLVLCTSIIAEGINVKNTNVGNVYAVGVKCPDTVRQFAARFRKMNTVDLFLILPPEKEPGMGFSWASPGQIEYLTDRATLAAKRATSLSKTGDATNYDRSNIFPHIMPNEAGDGFTVDHLAILATERGRMLDTAPTSYIIGRLLSYDGFTLAKTTQAATDNELDAALDNIGEVLKANRDAALDVVRPMLTDSPDKAVAALTIHYQRTGDRNSVNRLEILTDGTLSSVNELDALAWLHRYEDHLAFPEVRELIRRAAQLHFAGVIETATWLELPAREWKKKWQQIKTAFGLQALAKRPKSLPAGLRLDLTAKRVISKALDDVLNGSDMTITDNQLTELIRDAIDGTDKRKGMHRAPCLTTITKGRAVAIIEELYQIENTRHGTKRLLTVGAKHSEIPPGSGIVATCLTLNANPLKIRYLVGES
jgi:hypothetical protein